MNILTQYFLIFLFISCSLSNSTFIESPFYPNPSKDSIPKNRQYHPILFNSNKNRKNETLNFCGKQNGFTLVDTQEKCFHNPYIESLLIPSLIMLFLVILIVICLIIFTFIKHCCCSKNKIKIFNKKHWFYYLIGSFIIVLLFNVPFFILGMIGNCSMTVHLSEGESSVFTTYDNFKKALSSSLSVFQNFDTNFLEKVQTYSSTVNKVLDGKLEIESILKTIQSKIKNYNEVIDTLKSYFNSYMISREIIFDLLFIIPSIFIIIFLIGGCLKIYKMTLPLLPCILLFTLLSMIFLSIEFPITTIISDVCVYLMEESEKDMKKENKKKQIISKEKIVDEIIEVINNCQQSLLG